MSTKWVITLMCTIAIVKAQNGYSRDNPSNQLGYNPFGQSISDEDQINGGEIPGEAGRDYPIYDKVPITGFSCNNQQYPGYYADPESQCQAFYICQKSGRGVGFLCPNGTIFNQEFLVCDWWYNFDCDRAEQLYSVNEQVVRAMEEADEKRKQQQGGYNYDPSGALKNNGYQNGAIPQSNINQGPSNTYGLPSIVNGRNGQSNISPVYGVPGQSNNANNNNNNGRQNGNQPNQNYGAPAFNGISSQRYSSNGKNNGRYTSNSFRISNGNSNESRRYNGNGSNGNSLRPIYGPPADFGAGIQYTSPNRQNNNGFNGVGKNDFRNGNGGDSPARTYLPANIDNFNGNNNRNYIAQGNDEIYRNGLGNSPSNLDRTYLPPGGNSFTNGNTPSSQYGVPGQGNGFSGGYNGNRPNFQGGFNAVIPDRSYLPPSK